MLANIVLAYSSVLCFGVLFCSYLFSKSDASYLVMGGPWSNVMESCCVIASCCYSVVCFYLSSSVFCSVL